MSVGVSVLDQLKDGLGYGKVGKSDFNYIMRNTTEHVSQIKSGRHFSVTVWCPVREIVEGTHVRNNLLMVF